MRWITEDPVPLMSILFFVAVVTALLPANRGRKLTPVLLIAVFAVWLTDYLVVTPAERLRGDVQTLLNSFRKDDLQAIFQQIDEQADELKKVSEAGLKLVQLRENFHLKNVEVTVSPDGAEATVKLRANGQILIRESGAEAYLGTRWETGWHLKSGQWKLHSVKRLDPVTGAVIGILDRQ
ncbi:MAG: hypothetical protein ACK526_18045 [Planctomyces sp.]